MKSFVCILENGDRVGVMARDIDEAKGKAPAGGLEVVENKYYISDDGRVGAYALNRQEAAERINRKLKNGQRKYDLHEVSELE